MTHRAETITTTVLSRVTGLTTTGARVYRGRVYPLEEGPALLLYLGPDQKVADYSQEFEDWKLTLYLEARVKTVAAQVDTLLMKIREEVTIALQADYQQGLTTTIINTEEGDPDEPELSGAAEQPSGLLKMPWHFLYRKSRTNPGA